MFWLYKIYLKQTTLFKSLIYFSQDMQKKILWNDQILRKKLWNDLVICLPKKTKKTAKI